MTGIYSSVENLIIAELKKHSFHTFGKKECIIMYNDIIFHHEITENDFSQGLQSLVNKNLLIYKISDSDIKFYQLSDELKSMLDIE